MADFRIELDELLGCISMWGLGTRYVDDVRCSLEAVKEAMTSTGWGKVLIDTTHGELNLNINDITDLAQEFGPPFSGKTIAMVVKDIDQTLAGLISGAALRHWVNVQLFPDKASALDWLAGE